MGAHGQWYAVAAVKHLTPEVVPSASPCSFSDTKLPDPLLAQAAYFCFDAGTPLGSRTVRAAKSSAGCAFQAVAAIGSGTDSLAYALCRPPGHHATCDRYGGFCYFNNAALAAGQATPLGRVAVLDIHFHHGNGTQDITYQNDQIMYVSIHGDPNYSYPYFCGCADERGQGAGAGYNLNLPLVQGSDPAEYQPTLNRALDAIAGNRCCSLVVSVGCDTCKEDPLSGFAIRPEDFQWSGEAIASLGLPTAVVQEGGYALELIGDCAHAFVSGLVE